jgi:hypothetical protein
MYLVPTHRYDLLQFLPQNGRVVEIGVAEGNFSHEILTKNNPSVLHLIDPWAFQTRDDYQTDKNNVGDQKQEGRFRYVSKRFQSLTQQGRLHIHRDYSTNVANQFEDKSLDWIFIDGLHSYEGVKADLEAYADKVIDDGFILGHDYTNHETALEMGFGVIEAVNEFIAKTDYELFIMTWENYPTFVLCKDIKSQTAMHLLGSVLLQCSGALNLPDYPAKMTFRHDIIGINDTPITIPTFLTKE